MISTPSACIVAEKEKVAKVVLMPGDPLRAKYIAEKYLENPELDVYKRQPQPKLPTYSSANLVP